MQTPKPHVREVFVVVCGAQPIAVVRESDLFAALAQLQETIQNARRRDPERNVIVCINVVLKNSVTPLSIYITCLRLWVTS